MRFKYFLLLLVFPLLSIGQNQKTVEENLYIDNVPTLNLAAANQLLSIVSKKAESLGRNATVVILDSAGEIILVARGKNIGPHNTEAARRKAYTALSTKTGTLELMRNTHANPDSKNLNTLPELLLLSGGTPIFWNGNIVGSIGIAGGGSAENDDIIAKSAEIPSVGITTKNLNK